MISRIAYWLGFGYEPVRASPDAAELCEAFERLKKASLPPPVPTPAPSLEQQLAEAR